MLVDVKGAEVEQTSVIKLLGVHIDDKRNFGEHAKNTCIKTSRQVGVQLRLKNIIPERAKLQLYKMAIMPHLIYCSTVWHFLRASDQRKLERVQERVIRAVYRDKNSDYEKLLTKAKLTILHNRRLQDVAILMYEVENNLSSKYIVDLFNKKETK